MSTHTMTAEEFLESLNGFDEIAISQRFGKTVTALANEGDQMTLARALVFVAKRRDGLNDGDSYQACMTLTLREVNEYFAVEPDEAMPEEPETPEGKGD